MTFILGVIATIEFSLLAVASDEDDRIDNSTDFR
jgi:hypothetical protein